MTVYLLLILSGITSAYGVQEQTTRTVSEIFDQDLGILSRPLQITCENDGDKIKISEVFYKLSGCPSPEFRPQDPASESNRLHIYQCTGKRTCNINSEALKLPFHPRQASCVASTNYEIQVLYMCVAGELIHQMCSDLQAQDYSGYLASPNYPMLLQAGQPIAACRCHLEATLNSRVVLNLLEVNLGIPRKHPDINDGQTNKGDMDLCQTENTKQFLQLNYNYALSTTAWLCTHKYNIRPDISYEYDFIFENPLQREAGSLWIQYSAEDKNAMVKVICSEPKITTLAPMHYTKSPYLQGEVDYKIILGVIAASLFIIILVACTILLIKYRRLHPDFKLGQVFSRIRMNHFMMYKYSRANRKEAPTQEVIPSQKEEDSEQPDDETGSLGKPTAHITPHQTATEDIELCSKDSTDTKLKPVTGKTKYSTFSSYINNSGEGAAHSNSVHVGGQSLNRSRESSMSSLDEESEVKSSRFTTRLPTVVTAATPPDSRSSSRSSLIPNTVQSNHSPALQYEDIWVKVNTPDHVTSSRSVLLDLNNEENDNLLTTSLPPLPSLTFNPSNFTTNPESNHRQMKKSGSKQRDKQRSSLLSEDEEMDIKQPCIAAISPFRPSKSSSSSPASPAPLNERPAVTFSLGMRSKNRPPGVFSAQPRSSQSLDSVGRSARRSPSQKTSPSHFKNPRSPKPQPASPSKQKYETPISKLTVDLSSRSNSLPRRSTNQQSADPQFSHQPKRQKRKNASPISTEHQDELTFFSEPNSPLEQRVPMQYSSPRKASSGSASALAPLPEGRPMGNISRGNRGVDSSLMDDEKALLTIMQRQLQQYDQ